MPHYSTNSRFFLYDADRQTGRQLCTGLDCNNFDIAKMGLYTTGCIFIKVTNRNTKECFEDLI